MFKAPPQEKILLYRGYLGAIIAVPESLKAEAEEIFGINKQNNEQN